MIRLLKLLTLRRHPTNRLVPIYSAVLLLFFHNFVVAYLNSSYLEQFVPTTVIGTIYTVGAAVSVLVFLFISRVLHKVGNYKLTLALLFINFIAVIGMAFATTLEVAIPLFIVFLICVPLMVFNLDVFLEQEIGNDETATGSRRGFLLTLGSLIGALSPLVGGVVLDINANDFTAAYLASAFALLPIILILIFYFSDFSDPEYDEIDLFSAIRSFWIKRSVRSVLIAHFTLQLFFMVTVVYLPLYIVNYVGLSWSEFGIIMFVGGMAYVLLEYPIGIIADKYIGEKEMMALGFLILALSIAWMSFTLDDDVLLWAVIMFVMRIGASLVEATTESYFFKQTKSNDAQIISFFRITRPLAYVLGTLLAGLCLLYLPFNFIFIGTAFLMIPALFLTLDIEDTK